MTAVRVLVDGRPITHATAGGRGIGNYTIGLLEGLHEIGVDVVALVDDSSRGHAAFPADIPTAPWRHELPLGQGSTWYVATGLFLHPIDFDPIPRAVTHAGLPVAGVIYDMIPYQDPTRYQPNDRARRLAALRAPLARSVDLRLSISRYAGEAARRVLGVSSARDVTIGAGCRTCFLAARRRSPEEVALVPDGIATVVSLVGSDPRKNAEGLLRAWAQLRPPTGHTARLVLLGDASDAVANSWRDLAGDLGIGGSVTIELRPDDDTLVKRFRTADLVVQPSLEEGFGMATIEAAACGTPVVASSAGAGVEIVDRVATFDPRDEADVVSAIELGLWDRERRQRLITASDRAARKWTWPKVGRRVIDGLSTTAVATRSGLRPSIAVIGRAAQLTGSDHHAVLDALAPTVAIRLVSSSYDEPASPNVWPRRSLGRSLRFHDFDALVVLDGPRPTDVPASLAILADDDPRLSPFLADVHRAH